ncbi:hypothetical protein [Pseudonocardia sp. GCM10023141]|uniref:hypothetical protein n=1 Tax=Pseudonocardia sp. GCM10023141 TaxID=3252653 RepID=UPI0036171F2D
MRLLTLRDKPLHRACNSLLRRKGGGDDLLAYKVGRQWVDVRAEHLNEQFDDATRGTVERAVVRLLGGG